ncbi:MerR family transcriptional regulator [Paenibacillus sinopodophylli]|uniref:MerR family transcriptional regulator n=1 Tax=Paenibacillus sinopodophylli TaxID=1837342 RepID=UPI001486A657|nr:MerR family transcriptional regulator [Paenibacillus sinopodophylli]
MNEIAMSDVAKRLQMADSSLRRWFPLMEQAGYVFERKENNRRQLTEQDIVALLEMKRLSQVMTLPEACQRVVQLIPLGNKGNRGQEEQEFERLLSQLSDAIYWQGTEGPIAQLRSQWEKVKSS